MRRPTWPLVAAVAALVVAAGSAAALLRQGRELDEPIVVGRARRPGARARDPARRATTTARYRRYPVVYFLHGLPERRSRLPQQRLARRRARAAPARRSSSSRKARATTTPTPSTSTGAPAATGRRTSRASCRATIDARFRTIRSRSGRAIVGLSAGGYGATVVGLHHHGHVLGDRVVVGLLPPDRPDRDAAARPRAAANAHRLVGAAARRPDVLRVLRRGAATSGSRTRTCAQPRADGREASRTLRALPGQHTRARSGRAHAAPWLRLALAHLADQPVEALTHASSALITRSGSRE